MTLQRIIELRDELSAVIAYESQNIFLRSEVVKVSDSNARLLTALTQSEQDMRVLRAQVADRDREIARLTLALDEAKTKARVGRRKRKRDVLSPRVVKRQGNEGAR